MHPHTNDQAFTTPASVTVAQTVEVRPTSQASKTTLARSIPFGRPMIGDEEREAVMEVLSGPTLTHGPQVRQFEAAFAEFT
ncbi:MAG: DegT/DnrJ/EryC1/StrS family aminotransferase, partial [Phycisphaerales bacterium]